MGDKLSDEDVQKLADAVEVMLKIFARPLVQLLDRLKERRLLLNGVDTGTIDQAGDN